VQPPAAATARAIPSSEVARLLHATQAVPPRQQPESPAPQSLVPRRLLLLYCLQLRLAALPPPMDAASFAVAARHRLLLSLVVSQLARLRSGTCIVATPHPHTFTLRERLLHCMRRLSLSPRADMRCARRRVLHSPAARASPASPLHAMPPPRVSIPPFHRPLPSIAGYAPSIGSVGWPPGPLR
jgi:hypothetical protein